MKAYIVLAVVAAANAGVLFECDSSNRRSSEDICTAENMAVR